jgi:dihydropyrimidine dehydrogenase (NAD+) subunit PreA
VEDCITMVRTDDGTKHKTWKERSDANDIPLTFNDEKAGGRGHWVPEPLDALKTLKPKHYGV